MHESHLARSHRKIDPIFVGLVAIIIAALQYRISRDKLRLDLFGKRLETYEKLQEFFNLM